MTGHNYIALRRLSDKDGNTLAKVGEVCTRIPEASLAALLASKKIELLKPAAARAKEKA